jgi:serine phosphatase RsbU (regulator of sigma subunit)
VANLEIAGISVPALEVGGDFYDYLDARADRVTIVVGDVSGKGTSAALYMSKIQGILHSLEDFDLTLPELFARLNRILGPDLSRAAFVTALGVKLLGSDRAATVVRAGHLPLYYYRSLDTTVTALTPKGMGIGLDDDHLFEEELELLSLTVAPGDVLCCVTDGLTEARNAEGEEFGEERLRAALARYAGAGFAAHEVRDHLLADLAAFAAGAFQHDDQTLVVVRAV